MQRVDFLFDLTQGHVHLGRHFFLLGCFVWQELVQGWVQQANGYRQAVHRFENTFKVAALYRLELT